MDRQARKANLKKLRLTGIRRDDNNSLRKNLSDSSSISKYFKSPITKEHKQSSPKENNGSGCDSDVIVSEPCDHPVDSFKELSNKKAKKRTSLKKFINKDGANMDNAVKKEFLKNDDEDFETPVKRVKKPINVRTVRPASNRKKSRGKDQPDIKSSLMRSEEVFSKITSEYCRYDNFSPDEIHLALALSKSQMETSHTTHLDLEEDSVHKKVEIDNGNLDNVQDILRQYGFRATSSEVYSSLTAPFLPGAKRRTKTKWANKFTALTLRDPKYQMKKLQVKINALMAQQVDMNTLVVAESQKGTYSLLSSHLQKLQPNKSTMKVFADEHRANLDEFYVRSLFEVANVQAGYLLKDWHAIEGRDKSPKHRPNKITNFSKFEDHYEKKHNLDSTSQGENAILEKNSSESSILTNKYKESIKQEGNLRNEKMWGNTIESVSANELFEENSPDHRNEVTPELNKLNNSISDTIESNSCTSSKNNSESFKTLSCRLRILSPNIFASSEDESEESIAPQMLSENKMNESTENGEGDVIDLTQEIPSDQPEIESNAKVNEGVSIDNLHKNEGHGNKLESFENANLIVTNTLYDQFDGEALPTTHICSYTSSNEICVDGLLREAVKPNKKVFKSPVVTASENKKNIRNTPLNFSRSKSDSFASISENANSSAVASSSLTFSSDNINEDGADSSEDCIVLSDDEINYSIWKADKSILELNENTTKDAELTNRMEYRNYNNLCSLLDVTEEQKALESNTDKTPIPEETLFTDEDAFEVRSPFAKANRSTELLEFGILDNISEPFTQTYEILKTSTDQADTNSSLIVNHNTPLGMDDLLTGDISFSKIRETGCCSEVNTYMSYLQLCTYPPDEYEIEGRIYSTRIVTDSKPNFTHQTEAEILKQLYEFGIKPLKRKHAVKMLEYIYNSTHPLILEQTPHLIKQTDCGIVVHERSEKSDFGHSVSTNSPSDTLQLKDCFGFNMRSFIHNLQLDCKCEEYIFQTNITKKTSRPLLPFHIAWYNLVSSSTILHETILMYKPIDLQEIFLFFKQLGYRYEPKDIKEFLDRRCIIFRYDLTQPDRQSNRHIRKCKTKPNKIIKNM
ncbi:unnamed protein product [Ceratitis capitata]|uniref:Structure-specific endonuclease subunit SLX4 n=1 Tax=Ceratitis capitata TaxID=7213 RepID=A0A811UVZ5_CERCA|nr:unnamed protein product [Ceratitis capitata]